MRKEVSEPRFLVVFNYPQQNGPLYRVDVGGEGTRMNRSFPKRIEYRQVSRNGRPRVHRATLLLYFSDRSPPTGAVPSNFGNQVPFKVLFGRYLVPFTTPRRLPNSFRLSIVVQFSLILLARRVLWQHSYLIFVSHLQHWSVSRGTCC